MEFAIDRIDHVVINCRDVDRMQQWYTEVLGMTVQRFGPQKRTALHFGVEKMNLRPTGAARWETAKVDAPGSLDLCFVTNSGPDAILEHLRSCGVQPSAGPVRQVGALGPMTSVYCRDPDGNLVEIAHYGE